MPNTLNKLFLCSALIFLFSEVFGQHITSPAPYAVTVKQPDGTTLQVKGKGSPFYNWMETADGYTIVQTESGWYVYALPRQGQDGLQPSTIVAKDPGQRPADTFQKLGNAEKHIRPPLTNEIKSTLKKQFFDLGTPATELDGPMPKKGKIKVLAILVDYPDLPGKFEKADFNELFNGTNGEYTSFKEFYLKNSFGNLDVTVDIAGWYTAKNNYEYYGRKNGYSRTQELVADAIEAANPDVNFSNYDNDKNGYVDGVVIVHAGPGAEEGALDQYIWSHRWTISEVKADGVLIKDYCVDPEKREYYGRSNHLVGIGVLAHEFGHLFGLPDLYDVDQSSEGIGEWGLMGSGGWLGGENNPGGMCAWSREKLGWIKPIDITDQYGSYELDPVVDGQQVYKIRTPKESEYFLLENRTAKGIDNSIPGEGLAIWHINNEVATTANYHYNSVNEDEDNKGIDLEEADSQDDLDNNRNRGDWNDLYPYYQDNVFDSESYPNSNYTNYSDQDKSTGIQIKDIAYQNEKVSFTYRRNLPNSGNNCNNPIAALPGENQTDKTPQWFSFTMPKSGSLSINTGKAKVPTRLNVYQSCDDTNPIATVQSSNKPGTEPNNLYVPHLAKGEEIFFQWAAPDQPGADTPFSWELFVETEMIASKDSLSLVTIYQEMGGKKWVHQDNWLKKPLSSWYGLTIKNGRVAGINFDEGNQLSGTFPDAFYTLDSLQELQVFGMDSSVNKTVDARLYTMKNLKKLRLSFPTSLESIEKISSLTRLTELSLKFSQIKGSLPTDINQLSKIKTLEINAKQGNMGSIPEAISNCSDLEILALHPVSGNLPNGLGNLSKLTQLLLADNQLTKAIPESLGNLKKLRQIDLSHNQLSEKVPGSIFNLPVLASLNLSYNQVSELPENFFEGNNLSQINISHNKLKGSLPKTIPDKLMEQMALDLSNNQLSGALSPDFANIQFSSLNLSHNQLEGTFPAVMLEGENIFDISYNRFTALASLKFKKLSGNIRCSHNLLSFDDLDANLSFFHCINCNNGNSQSISDEWYSPQDTLLLNKVIVVTEGQAGTISIEVDEKVKNNRYVWFKDGNPIDTTSTNFLEIKKFGPNDTGNYHCEVTNSKINNLTLYYSAIQLSLKNRLEQFLTLQEIKDKTYGDPPFKLQFSSSATLPVSIEKIDGPVNLEGDSIRINGAGEVTLRLYSEGDNDYLPVDSLLKFTVTKASQELIIPTLEDRRYAPADTFSLNITSTSDLPVVLQYKKGNIDLAGNRIITKGAGKVVLQASQAGNENYQAAPEEEIAFTIAKAPQNLTFDTLNDQTFGVPPMPLHATSSVDLPVSFRVTKGKAQITDNYLTIEQVGAFTVEAYQDGTENYEKANSISHSFVVSKAGQIIFFDTISTRTPNDPPFQMEAYASSHLPVMFEVIDGPAMIEDGLCTILGAGSVIVKAYQDGNVNFLPAEPVIQGFQIAEPGKSDQIISVNALPDTVQVGEQWALDIRSSSALKVDVHIEGPALFANDSIQFTREGEVKIKLTQAGNAVYNPAPTRNMHVFVQKTKQPQAISLTTLPDTVLVGDHVTIEAAVSSGLTPGIQVSGPAILTKQNEVQFTGEGTVKLTISQSGNEDYLPASPIKHSFWVIPAKEPIQAQALSFDMLQEEMHYDNKPLTIPVEASSGLPLTYLVEGPAKEINGELHITGTGLIKLIVFQPGNEEFAPSDTAFYEIQIMKATQIVTLDVQQQSDSVYQINPQASSGLPVSLLITGASSRLENDLLYVQENGTVMIQAYQAGDTNYLPADTVAFELEVEIVTGTEENREELAWLVYPNPSNNIFHVQSPEKSNHTITYTLIDARGKIVEEVDQPDSHIQLDLSDRSAGVYFLRIHYDEQIFWQRLIKR